MNLKLLVLNFHLAVSPDVRSHCFGPYDWRPWAWLCSWPSEKPANCVHFPSQQTDHAGVQDQLSYNYFLIDLNFSSSFSFNIDFEPHFATECYCLMCFDKYFSIWLSLSAWAFPAPCFASVASMKQLQDHQGSISMIHMIADFRAPIFHHRTGRANDCYDSSWASWPAGYCWSFGTSSCPCFLALTPSCSDLCFWHYLMNTNGLYFLSFVFYLTF